MPEYAPLLHETEVKFLNINQEQIIKKLKSIKAEKIFDGNIKTVYYDKPDKSLAKQDKLVRLRTKECLTNLNIKKNNPKNNKTVEVELTFKKKLPSSEAKVAEEKNFIIKDMKTAESFLKSINLVQSGTIPNKHRISYKLKDIQFELDAYENCPTFLEIESDNINSVKQGAKLLNLNFKDAKTFTANELLNYFKDNNLMKNNSKK